MRKIIVSEGISLDGVFDAQTMGQWAVPYYSEEREEFVRAAILSADALLLGRTTYDLQAWYWPNQKDDKYGIADHKNRMVKFVVTSTPLQAQWNNSNVIQNNALDEIAALKQQPGQDILIEGSGTLVESLARAGLIDEYRILLHPSIAGSGKRFFKGGINLSLLRLVENKTLSQGVVALRYEPGEK